MMVWGWVVGVYSHGAVEQKKCSNYNMNKYVNAIAFNYYFHFLQNGSDYVFNKIKLKIVKIL